MSDKENKRRFALNISIKDRTVYIDFPEPIQWIGMDKIMALQLADMIITHANQIKDRNKEN